jgi:hypothetical protein
MSPDLKNREFPCKRLMPVHWTELRRCHWLQLVRGLAPAHGGFGVSHHFAGKFRLSGKIFRIFDPGNCG